MLLAPDARDPRGFSAKLSDFGLSVAQHQWRTATTMEGKGTVSVRGRWDWRGRGHGDMPGGEGSAAELRSMDARANWLDAWHEPLLCTVPSTSTH